VLRTGIQRGIQGECLEKQPKSPTIKSEKTDSIKNSTSAIGPAVVLLNVFLESIAHDASRLVIPLLSVVATEENKDTQLNSPQLILLKTCIKKNNY
jgi:hypothetical protein